MGRGVETERREGLGEEEREEKDKRETVVKKGGEKRGTEKREHRVWGLGSDGTG